MSTQPRGLSIEERAELAYLLIRSIDEDGFEEVEAAWDEVLARRAEEIREGRVTGKSADAVFAELREEYA